MEDYFSFDRVWAAFPKVLDALPTSLLIVGVAAVAGGLLAIVLAFVRVYRIPVLNPIVGVYISFMRGTPEIIQLFLVYYGLPLFTRDVLGVSLDDAAPLIFVLITFSLNQAAFFCELFRGALEAVDAGQYEAAYASGLTRLQAFSRIVIPQAIRIVLPGLGVNLVYLFQSTSLAATIGVMDLVGKAQIIGSITYHSMEPLFCTLILFVTISIVIEVMFTALGKRVSFGAKEVA